MIEIVDGCTGRPSEGATRPFRVLMMCGGFLPGFRYGGPVRSLVRIVDTVSDRIDLTLVTRDRDLATPDPYPGLSGRWVRRGGSRVFYMDPSSIRHWRRLWREFRVTSFDLLYVNSLFSLFSIIPIVAARLGVIRVARILVAPRGELKRGALSSKRWKKEPFLWLWMPLLKVAGVVWHATSDREAADIRRACRWARIEVNGSQVSLPLEPLPVPAAGDGVARLVFISRISPEKNLDLALRALQRASTVLEFDIYGPLEDAGYWKKCKSLLDDLPSNVRVRYCGELNPDEVRSTFVNYDVFVFPTVGENFGHVIAESLSASCPVICSDQTPWTDVLDTGGGVVLRALAPEPLAEELDRIGAMEPADRLHARHAAAHAYRLWRRRSDGPNILEQARQSEWVRHP
ncbi:glycosyltransferase [Micromonospora sp. DH14]|uniref:glycosyltransferase n=1 Tax=Micromonospora sp. DH14 TaxID=3040120 RepID=UPI002441EEA5|nr:glycosyltransferase [Micromonospora sp. DH14]MDG9675547.1 glycosyltransferase [Micromonospora sp. DH14]